jgi:hypothetical protein
MKRTSPAPWQRQIQLNYWCDISHTTDRLKYSRITPAAH